MNWAQSKGEDGLKLYREEMNVLSIDGLATGYAEAGGAGRESGGAGRE